MRLSLSIICVLLVGCLGQSGSPDESTDAASAANVSDAAALLSQLDRSQIDQAVRRLGSFDYVLDRNVKVTDETGSVVVRHAYVTAFSGPSQHREATISDSTMSGGGDAGFWAEYVGNPEREDTLNWSLRLLEDEPLVLTPQGRGYYRYTMLEDTTIGSFAIKRVDARLMKGTDRSGIQSARFFIDADRNKLVGFNVEFTQRSLLFDEESTFRYLLQEGPDGTWLPSEVDVRTYLNLPLSKGQVFELHARYLNPR